MASTKWNVGLNGSWTVGANWSAGVPNFATDVTIGVPGNYTVTLTAAGFANSLTVNSASALFSETASGTLDIANALTLDAGKVALKGANTIGGGVTMSGGTLETGNNAALGTGTLTMSAGELLGLSNETFTNQLAMSGNLTFAAAHSTTMNENASSWAFDATDPGSILFGQGANDGTVVWHTVSGSITNPDGFTTEIVKGTVQAGDNTWGFMFENAARNTIDSAGTLDIAGFSGTVANLQGSGSIINSGGAATLSVAGGGMFTGVISGGTALEVSSGTLVLTNANTYGGGTTIDSGATLQLGNGGATGTIAGSIDTEGTLIYDHSNAFTQTAGLTGAGGVTYEGGGGVTINRSEAYAGDTDVIGETVNTNKANAFGTSTVTLTNAELVVTGTGNMTYQRVGMAGDSTFAAAHGKTVGNTNADTSGAWTLDASGGGGATLNINDAVNDGTVVWYTNAGSTVIDIDNAFVEVHSGVLRAGDSSFGFLTEDTAGTTVDTGATLDLASFGATIINLEGSGSVTAHAGAAIGIDGGVFAGVISGVASVEISDGTVLTGANTYSRGTTIDSGAALALGNGGTTGSIAGNIVDNGVLVLDRSDAIAETAAISGTGQLNIVGGGTVTIHQNESYSGGTNLGAGELSIDRAQAIGTGALNLSGGEFLTTATLSVDGALTMSNHVIIAAASGTQANFNSATGWTLDGTNPASIQFGDGTNSGTVLWHTPAGSTVIHIGNSTIDVHSGVLKAGDDSFSFLTGNAQSTTVDTGASINLAGFTGDIIDLLGSGTVGNTGAATTLAIEGGNFAGAITGALTQVQLYDAVTLSAGGSFSGEFLLETGAALDLSGHWAQNLEFSGAGTVVLHTAAQYTGHFVNFQMGDIITVRNVDESAAGFTESYNATTGVLSISDGTHSANLTFNGAYVQNNFSATSDGHGDTNIAFAPSEVRPVLMSDYPDHAAGF